MRSSLFSGPRVHDPFRARSVQPLTNLPLGQQTVMSQRCAIGEDNCFWSLRQRMD